MEAPDAGPHRVQPPASDRIERAGTVPGCGLPRSHHRSRGSLHPCVRFPPLTTHNALITPRRGRRQHVTICREASLGQAGDDHVARLKFELHLPGLVIGVDDIKLTGLSRRSGQARPVGPYLIAGRASGLALDATLQYDQGPRVTTWPPHALPHQLWYLRPSGVKDEATIISAASGLALDSTVPTSGDIHPVMWEPNGEPWQRWRLEPAPDGIGFRSSRRTTETSSRSPKKPDGTSTPHGPRGSLPERETTASSGSSPCPWAISDPVTRQPSAQPASQLGAEHPPHHQSSRRAIFVDKSWVQSLPETGKADISIAAD